MVKCELLLVILVIGYLDAKSTVIKLTDDENFVSGEVLPPEEQLLPITVEDDYQNDENLDPDEGSGFAEDVKIQNTDKVSSPVVEDDISKEKDESVSEESKHMEEEIVNVPQVSEEENLSMKSEETDNEKVDVEGTAEVADEENQSINSEERNDTTNTNDDEELKYDSVAEGDDEENHSIKSEETNDTKTDAENQSKDQIEEHILNNEESSEKQLPIANSAEANEDTENQSQLSADVKPDAIEDDSTTIHQDNIDRINADNQNKPGDSSSSAPGELEPIVDIVPQETDTDKTVDEEDHTSMIVAKATFPNEKDLPAERFGKMRGLGKSMPMQDAAIQPIDNEVIGESEMPRKDEHALHDRANNEHRHENAVNVPDNKNENIIKGTLGESDKELPNTGASETSSSSSTVTFLIILGLVAVVGSVGYFVYNRRKGYQRATSVPTHEDRELKEVKTHRLDDGSVDGGGQKSVCHIPEANPLILTNHHLLKGTESDKNGHLPTMQQQPLTTFLSPQKEDDIRMMDDDVEDEVGAERRPLFTATTAALPEQVDTRKIVQQRAEVGDDKLRERED